jgi:hypothetical protein
MGGMVVVVVGGIVLATGGRVGLLQGAVLHLGDGGAGGQGVLLVALVVASRRRGAQRIQGILETDIRL